MKRNWEFKKLGEVATFSRGLTFSKGDVSKNSSKKVLRSNNIDSSGHSLVLEDVICLNENFLVPDEKKLHKGDIFICMSNGSTQHLGKVAYVENNIDYAFGGFMGAIHPNQNDVTPKFVFYACISPKYRCFLSSVLNGVNINNLKWGDLCNFLIPIPQLSEQQRIVAELDLLQGIIDKQKTQLKEYDTLAQSIFYDMFGDPVENENGWELRTLDEVCSKITDGTHDTPQRYNTGIRFITGKHIKPYLIDYEKSDYVTEEVHKEIYSRCNPEKGDVLYTNIGAGTGNAALNTVSYEFSMKNVALLKVLKDMIDGYYVEYFLNNEKIRKRIIENFSNGGAQSFLSLKSIAKIPILLPPLSLQQQFAEKIEAIEHQKTLIKKSIEETQKLFDYTMDKYFG